ncbi:MAG: caspase family protein [Myxococcota bacterium]
MTSPKRAVWATAILGAALGCTPTGIRESVALGRSTEAFPTPWADEKETASLPEPTSPRRNPLPKATPSPLPDADAYRARALVTATPQPRTYALVVAIEDYRDIDAAATGADEDRSRVEALLTRTLGVPTGQVRVAAGPRATRSDVLGHIDWLVRNVTDGARVLFFFSGHGSARANDGEPLLLPYDSDRTRLERSGLLLSDILGQLGASPAGEVVAFIDACYSGSGGRSVIPEGARPLLRHKESVVPAGIAVLTAAGAGQLSGADPEGQMGLLTKHVVVGLGEGRADVDGDGQIRLEELVTYVTPRVARDARTLGREQEPRFTTSLEAGALVLGHGYAPL